MHAYKVNTSKIPYFLKCLHKEPKHRRYRCYLKDTHREKAPSNNTPGFTKSMNMDIWVIGTSNQLFLRGS